MNEEIKPDHTQNVIAMPDLRKARNIIILLAASVALMMTGYGIVMPVMAKRLGELGAGVETLGFMTMAFAIGQFLLAPFMGSLADRFGRRPLILTALAGEIIANILFLLISSTGSYIGIRFFQGAISAGLLPASMGVVGDIFPENKRGQWTGILMGSYGFGFIFGPGMGGILYDSLGFVAPFAVSAGLALVALVFASLMVPETRPASARKAGASGENSAAEKTGIITSLPRPLYLFGALLTLDFLAVFVFAFIEPQLAFFLYNDLKFSTSQFGLLVSGYGLAMVIGQLTLGRLSDRIGRNPIIALGFLLNAGFYFGLTQLDQFFLLLLLALMAGLGNSLVVPALSSYYLNITAEEHRSRIMGVKESVAALGGAIGPLLVAVVSGWTTPQGIFLISAGLALVAVSLALVALKGKPQVALPAKIEQPLPEEAQVELESAV
jgi:MFS family permease